MPLSPKAVDYRMALIPVVALFAMFGFIIIYFGSEAVSDYSPYALLISAAIALMIAFRSGSVSRRGMAVGLRKSARQILPAIPMLLLIAALATTWMMSGVVPTLVDYGLKMMNPQLFLLTTCATCAIVSVLTGSSWSTIATIGVAFIAIGDALGYDSGWTAGAIISGAYFGDKVSPLSDTTVLAASTCQVDLFSHIKYMMITTIPAMAIALIVFAVKGMMTTLDTSVGSSDILSELGMTFNLSPWTMIIPAITLGMIICRVPTLLTLAVSSILGGIGVAVFQPEIYTGVSTILYDTLSGFEPATRSEALLRLCSTGGVIGILPVVFLVISALLFGWIMIGTGILGTLTDRLTRRLRRRTSIIGASLVSGITLNACTADQYLSLILNGNMFKNTFRRHRMEPRLLSRTIEDGVSVTSVLVPWSSCGVTQSSVLGVPALTYIPYCIFNYLTPVMSLVIISTGYRIRNAVSQRLTPAVAK